MGYTLAQSADRLSEPDDPKDVIDRLHTRTEDLRYLMRLGGWKNIEIVEIVKIDRNAIMQPAWAYVAEFTVEKSCEDYIRSWAARIMGEMKGLVVTTSLAQKQPCGAVVTPTNSETYYDNCRIRLELESQLKWAAYSHSA